MPFCIFIMFCCDASMYIILTLIILCTFLLLICLLSVYFTDPTTEPERRGENVYPPPHPNRVSFPGFPASPAGVHTPLSRSRPKPGSHLNSLCYPSPKIQSMTSKICLDSPLIILTFFPLIKLHCLLIEF